jgi:outer membrane lipoprotein SlyB
MNNSTPNPEQNRNFANQPNPEQNAPQQAKSHQHHPVAEELGAVGGGIAGAAIGKSVKGNVGAVVGGIAGAIAGGAVANSAANFTDELLQETQPSLSLGMGADNKPVDLPRHYSWEELQALSKPQL